MVKFSFVVVFYTHVIVTASGDYPRGFTYSICTLDLLEQSITILIGARLILLPPAPHYEPYLRMRTTIGCFKWEWLAT